MNLRSKTERRKILIHNVTYFKNNQNGLIQINEICSENFENLGENTL